jgi:hypothetical protein
LFKGGYSALHKACQNVLVISRSRYLDLAIPLDARYHGM